MSGFEGYETIELIYTRLNLDREFVGQSFRVKHAATAEQRRQGLAGAVDLDVDGMLFSYEYPVFRPFWMRRTYLPLVIAFFDKGRHLICSRSMQPMQTDPVLSTGPFQYAIEFVKGREPYLDHGYFTVQ